MPHPFEKHSLLVSRIRHAGRKLGNSHLVPHQRIGNTLVHIDLDAVGTGCLSVLCSKVESDVAVEVNGIARIFLIVDGAVAFAAALYNLRLRHSLGITYHRDKSADVCALGKRVGVEYDTSVKVDGEEDGVEVLHYL